MMKKIILPAILLFLAGSGFFAYTYYEWRHFTPEINLPSRATDKKPIMVPLPHRRDSTLLYNNPFFPSEEEAPRGSRLILRGTVVGPHSLAVVEARDQPGESHLVRAGEVVLGEKILSIHEGWITIANSRGETIVLKMEEPNLSKEQ